jgi:outer membrane receptor for monomeric catechols
MKTSLFKLALLLTALCSTGALASDKAKTKDPKQEKAAGAEKAAKNSDQSASQREKTLTGSYLKQDVKRNGNITDGFNQVLVIDRAMIEQSGASDLKQVLAHRGIH